jgi:hypothetical protein
MHKWSAKVTETSDALDLKPRVFRAHDPKRIAASLKHSALRSRRRKASPFPAAMQDRQLSADSGRSSDCGGVGISDPKRLISRFEHINRRRGSSVGEQVAVQSPAAAPDVAG